MESRISMWPLGLLFTGLALLIAPCHSSAQVNFLLFDGTSNYVEIPDNEDFSVTTNDGVRRGLTVSAWIRPDTLFFPSTEGSGYVHWLGKGEPNRQEWVFRMYSLHNTENRENRISFYLFNLDGKLGVGSYFQDAVTAGEWIHVVGVADTERVYIYKNGSFRRCDNYQYNLQDSHCASHTANGQPLIITPQRPADETLAAPVRVGARSLLASVNSFFQGGIREVRIWKRPLTCQEVAALYLNNDVPSDGLVAQYLLDETDGTIAHDSVGTHDGQIFGATSMTDVLPTADPPTSCPSWLP